jgi:branched-subunit amino acid ABC-type transport system permease component
MDYLFHILVMVSLFAILAASFNLLIGYAGLFALSHAAFFGVGAYATAILAKTYGVPFPLPILAAILVTGLLGLVIALPALRIGGDYLVVVTLALQVIVVAVMLNWRSLTGGTDGIPGIPRIVLFGDSQHAGLFEIRGPSGASVRADFLLPDALIADIGGQPLPVTFGPADGLLTQTRNVLVGLPFNPQGPVVTSLSGLGRIYLHLGGTANPGIPQTGGAYRATIVLTVYDLGS